MKRCFGVSRVSQTVAVFFGALVWLGAAPIVWAEAPAAAVSTFKVYAGAVEARLAMQHGSAAGFIVAGPDEARLRRGELIIERLSPAANGVPGALLHHWRGTAFAPGAKAADFERLIRDFHSYPQRFAPQVLEARVIREDGDRETAWMRVRQQHVITVVMDATYDVSFGRLDAGHGYSLSQSTRMEEVEAAGRTGERVLKDNEEHGFLWRLNTYWSYAERDGGLYVQIEAVSLTRAIPRGLGWVVKPYVESIPRESMEFTLRSACRALAAGGT